MLDVEHLIEVGGILLVALIVFAESGLLIGFFLPGDSLLFTAGFVAGTGKMNIVILVISIIASAIAGDSVGYYIGKKTGPKMFRREESLLFDKTHLLKAEKFYEKHGGKTIIIARFTPVIRTFAPMVAGIGKMDYRRFLYFNIVGGVLWGGSVTISGYIIAKTVGHVINIEKYLLPLMLLAGILSFAGTFIHIFKDQHKRRLLVNKLRRRRN